MKRILVTGAGGFIGRHALPLLAARGYEIHAVSSRLDGEREGVVWHRANLLDCAQTRSLVNTVKPDRLLHFAWCTTPDKYWTAEANVDWLTASVELLRAFSDSGGERAVVAGTCAEYDWSSGSCIEGVTPLRPSSLYGICKSGLRSIGAHIAAQRGFELAWGCIFYLFGPHEAPERLIPSVISSLLAGRPIVCSDRSKVRDFLYVEDVAAAFVALLESNLTGAVNVASGAEVTLGYVLDAIASIAGRPGLVEWGKMPSRENDPHTLTASVRRLRDEVGWSPRWTLEDGLRQTLEWWRQNANGGVCV